MKHVVKFLVTIIIAIFALVFQFIFHQPELAKWLVTIVGMLMALSMFIEMIKTLRSGKYGVDLLAITAIIATLAIGDYWASLMILVMLTGGDSLEDYASKKANTDLKSLLENSPQVAHKIVNDQISDIAIEAIEVGDVLLLKPGEVVPVDGKILKGQSDFDESSLTGESRPVAKTVNDAVMSGVVNGDSSITMKAVETAENSQYQNIIKLVKESEAKPAHFVKMADRYAVPFTLVSFLIAGVAWFVSKDPVRFAEVLVVASPCPLILAAPVALVSGMSRTSRNGIIVKSGTTLEKLADAKSVAFDKTGTITKGTLLVNEVNSVDKNISKEKLLNLAASVEQQSNHILARSLVDYATKQEPLASAENVTETTGAGVTAKISGQLIKVGKANFVSNEKVTEAKDTAIYVSIDDHYTGFITFKDTVRTESKETITELKQLHVQNILMLTGDQETIADEVADQVGITEVYAECLPEDKIKVLRDLPKEKRPVVMVGDGVNDAPALASADVGIAMGAHGSTAASETAQAVILRDDLNLVSKAVKISKDTMRIAKQSVLIGIFICVILMLIASTGVIPALVGALLQEVVDTVSILSSLRALKERA